MILTAIHFLAGARIHGLPNITHIDLVDPARHSLVGWTAHVRGPAIFIVSPPGWKYGVAKDMWTGAERAMFEVPRDKVCLQWSGGVAEMESVGKWSPIVPPAPRSESGVAIDDDELERLTQPKGAKNK